MSKTKKSEAEWKKTLSEEQYQILRKKGTELAFKGKYHKYKGKGMYVCAGCGEELFDSKDKYDPGSGWPSFTKPKSEFKINKKRDLKLIVPRTEVLCKKCGGHLGHVFKDGPKPRGQRYCINSGALKFKKS